MTNAGSAWPMLLLLLPQLVAADPQARSAPAPASAPTAPAPVRYCPNEYADDFSALTATALDLEAQTSYTVCIRTTATYECPSYGADGNLRRTKRKVSAHGTGFAYLQQGGETFLLTNEHVAEWPSVTQEDHPVEDVPLGCKRVAESLRIVDNDSDHYDRDDIALSRVVADVELDLAVLKTKAKIPVSPWPVGHSAGLKERNVVSVRGFPLGAFKANNVGKVVSAYDHDTYKEWDHDDFVIDALLSPGNSGSPVFAISCKTGGFELVGVYHAGYSRGSALNVVVAIDQVRDLMTTFKRAPRAQSDATAALDSGARAKLLAWSRPTIEPYFPFGPLVAAVRPTDDGTMFHVLQNKSFPFRTYPILVLEDLPPYDPSSFGALGRVWIGSRQGLKLYARSDLDREAQALIAKLLDGLRRDGMTAFAVREADVDSTSSREKFKRSERLERTLQKATASRAELAQGAQELAERLGPQDGDAATDLRAIVLPPPPVAAEPEVADPPPPEEPAAPAATQ